MKQGAIGAIYYFTILESQKRGYREIDLGATYPFLSHPLTSYKLSMGGMIRSEGMDQGQYLWLGLARKSPETVQFIQDNPFVYVTSGDKLDTLATLPPDEYFII